MKQNTTKMVTTGERSLFQTWDNMQYQIYIHFLNIYEYLLFIKFFGFVANVAPTKIF